MGHINKNNYEAFFLDYHEGNLSPQQVADLLLFLEQHPELKEEFENFENFTIEDFSVIEFENKHELKRVAKSTPSPLGEGWGEAMIASIEGLSTKEEHALLDQQLSVDAKLRHEFLLYQKTKLTADDSIVFENKEALKRKIKKVIPLHYYLAAAASIVLLLGLFFMFNVASTEQQLVEKEVKSQKSKVKNSANGSSSTTEINKEEKDLVNLSTLSDLVVKKEVRSQKSGARSQKLEVAKEEKNLVNLNVMVEKKESPIVSDNNQQLSINQQFATNNKQQTTNNEQLEAKDKVVEPVEILSLRELAVAKLKEKIVDETTLAAEKKTGRSKKLNGWDLAQLAAKGFNKLTGRSVEVKPTYNEQGDLIAYSLAAGEFQLSRGR